MSDTFSEYKTPNFTLLAFCDVIWKKRGRRGGGERSHFVCFERDHLFSFVLIKTIPVNPSDAMQRLLKSTGRFEATAYVLWLVNVRLGQFLAKKTSDFPLWLVWHVSLKMLNNQLDYYPIFWSLSLYRAVEVQMMPTYRVTSSTGHPTEREQCHQPINTGKSIRITDNVTLYSLITQEWWRPPSAVPLCWLCRL